MNIEELINICIFKKRIICIVGGGGKTTLMYMLARECAKAGKKVIVSTTTHILKPSENYASKMEEIEKYWNKGDYAVIGDIDPLNSEKLVFPQTALYDGIKSRADIILLEADGAKGFPCKVPAEHEPVIAIDCDLVIGVMGMKAMGHKLKDVCFRFDTNGAWLSKKRDEELNEDTAVRILSSEKGTRKYVGEREYIVVLNQCDDEDLLERAGVIADNLLTEYEIRTVCTELKNQ